MFSQRTAAVHRESVAPQIQVVADRAALAARQPGEGHGVGFLQGWTGTCRVLQAASSSRSPGSRSRVEGRGEQSYELRELWTAGPAHARKLKGKAKRGGAAREGRSSGTVPALLCVSLRVGEAPGSGSPLATRLKIKVQD